MSTDTEETALADAVRAAELAGAAVDAADVVCGDDPSEANTKRLDAAVSAHRVALAVVKSKERALQSARERLAEATRARQSRRAEELEKKLAPLKFEAAMAAPLRDLAAARSAVLAAHDQAQSVARRHADDLAEYDAICVQLSRTPGNVARIGAGNVRALATLALTKAARKDGTASRDAAALLPTTSLDGLDLAFEVSRRADYNLQLNGTPMSHIEQAERAARGEDVAAQLRKVTS